MKEAAGDVVQGEGLGQVVPDVVQNGGDPEKVLVADGLAGCGGVEGGRHPDQQVEQRNGLIDVAAEGTVVFIALQGLKQLNNLRHFLHIQGDAPEGVLGHLGEVGLGSGELGEGLAADVQDVPGVKAGGDGAVQGVFTDEVQRAPAQRIDLVVDKNVARTGQGKEQLEVVVKVEAAHAPGLVVVELKMEFYIGHRATSVNRENGVKRKDRGEKPAVSMLFPLLGQKASLFPLAGIIPWEEKICKFFAKLQIDPLLILW